MIAVDSSALIAILRREPEAMTYLRVLAASAKSVTSAVSVQEASMVLAGRNGDASEWRELDILIARMAIDVRAHDAALAAIARDAFVRFGKGRHPAKLNMGDCAAYALAKRLDVPLLFAGEHFTRTDLTAAA